jgi:hypothetical protein
MSVNCVKDVEEAALDIILVPGLKVDQENWTSAENSAFWPEKLLAPLIPRARILTFEYDGEPTIDDFWSKKDMVGSIAYDLVCELKEHRQDKLGERPIIWVAHCLGGLVVEKALTTAMEDEADKEVTVNTTAGILLLGTPHYQPGTLSEAKKYFQLAQKDIPSDADLEALSKHLLRIPGEFVTVRQANTDLKFATFYGGSAVDINGQAIDIVEESVARFPGDSSAPKMLKGNHHQISRFESENEKDFKTVFRVLKDWVGKLPEPQEQGTVNNIANTSFAGSTNYGMQLGQNTGKQTLNFGGR